MRIRFTKMHGLGNDFVVLDAVSQPIQLTTELARFLADRHFGVGCDQILVVESPRLPETDFRYRIFNADGSEVQQCGNGARCFARFVFDKGLTNRNPIRVETQGGIIAPTLTADGWVTVDMGVPRLDPAEIPFVSDSRDVIQPLSLGDAVVDITAVSMGNPHAVQVVADVDSAPVAEQGPLIEHHVRFPERVNAGFMQIVDRRHIKLRVFERGAGETLACGTGACAAVTAGILRGLLDSPVQVDTHGGSLSIAWAGRGEKLYMTGPAVTVFEGEIELP